jgi:opacity protein-like surface antigen
MHKFRMQQFRVRDIRAIRTALLLFAWVASMTVWSQRAWSQETAAYPKAEIFGTYSYFNIGGGGVIPRQSLNGWGAGYTPNFNRFLGATVQLMGGYGKINETFTVQRTGLTVVGANIAAHAFMGGPELSYRGSSFRLFAHGLAGPVHYSLKKLEIRTASEVVAAPELGEAETNFGWGVGGGIDMKITPQVSARLFQLDYIVEQSDPIRRHYRLAFGFVAKIGGE